MPEGQMPCLEDLSDATVVHQCDRLSTRPVAIGPRLARTGRNALLCTFATQSALGHNDCMPVACRSLDRGRTWSAPVPLWPKHTVQDSLFGSISPKRDAKGRLLFYGFRFHVDEPGEKNWQEDNFGLKQSELFY